MWRPKMIKKVTNLELEKNDDELIDKYFKLIEKLNFGDSLLVPLQHHKYIIELNQMSKEWKIVSTMRNIECGFVQFIKMKDETPIKRKYAMRRYRSRKRNELVEEYIEMLEDLPIRGEVVIPSWNRSCVTEINNRISEWKVISTVKGVKGARARLIKIENKQFIDRSWNDGRYLHRTNYI